MSQTSGCKMLFLKEAYDVVDAPCAVTSTGEVGHCVLRVLLGKPDWLMVIWGTEQRKQQDEAIGELLH